MWAGAGPGSTPLGKRKKGSSAGTGAVAGARSAYLSAWVERSARAPHDAPDSYEPCLAPAAYPYCPEPLSLPPYAYCGAPCPAWSAPALPECRCVRSASRSAPPHRPRVRRKPEARSGGGVGRPTGGELRDENDFASLPPIVTSVGDAASTSDLNATEDSADTRRFSDPCLSRALPSARNDAAAEDESEASGESEDTGGNKLVTCLVDQIKSLKLANDRLNKELLETRVELQSVRQQTSLWHKGSSSSLGPTQHLPHNNNGYVASPLQQYSPGALAELVREIRDAARLREEALYARVRSMIDERGLQHIGLSGASDKSAADTRNYEDIKGELRAAGADKRRTDARIARMEDELLRLRVASGLSEGAGTGSGAGSPESGEAEKLRLRRELSDARRGKQQADEHALKLERLVTQMRSKFNINGSCSGGPASLASSEHDAEPSATASVRARRTSANSANNSPHNTIVFGPVTDL